MTFLPTSLPSFTLLGLGFIVGTGLILFFERKMIAIGQKRLGISFVGRHGWLHLPADVFKFWLKDSSRYRSRGEASILSVLGGYIAWTLLSSGFFLSGVGTETVGLDLSLLLYFAYVNISTLYLAYLTATLKSKYSTLAGLRLALLNIFFEIPFSLTFALLYYYVGDLSWEGLPEGSPILPFMAPLGMVLLVFGLFESKRPPFDHTEAESELVAGHLIEYGGRALLLFFICEYLHFYFLIFFWTLLFLGGPLFL